MSLPLEIVDFQPDPDFTQFAKWNAAILLYVLPLYEYPLYECPMRTYNPKIVVLSCRFNGLDYMFSVRLPSGTVNWVKARRTKAGKWSITWPTALIQVEGKQVRKQVFVPARRITEYVIAAFDRHLAAQSNLKSIETSEGIEQEPSTERVGPVTKPRKGPPGTVAFCPCGERVHCTREDDPHYIECEGCHRVFNALSPEYETLVWKAGKWVGYTVTPCCKARGEQEPAKHLVRCPTCGKEYNDRDNSVEWGTEFITS